MAVHDLWNARFDGGRTGLSVNLAILHLLPIRLPELLG